MYPFQKLKQELVENIDNQLQELVEDVVQEVDQLDTPTALNGSRFGSQA